MSKDVWERRTPGPESVAASGGNRQAEYRQPQEAAECRNYADFPPRE